jgi:dsDNA-specific endonuclease/ATPase MutS2
VDQEAVGPGGPYDGDDDDGFDPEAPVVVPLTDELDLHAFAPREVAEIVRDWLADCAEAGFASVRIVHGKGIGQQREIVRKVLESHPEVASFRQDAGNWGATVVELRGVPRR